MTDRSPHPMMMMLLEQSTFVGPSETVEDEITPLDDQLNLVPGNKCIAAAANTMLEQEFTFMEILDAEEYAEQFPDWYERVTVKIHVLCRYYSQTDPEGTLGWFARLKLLPISEEHFEVMKGWLEDEFPDDLPEWVRDYYSGYTDELNKQAPHRVPTLTTCPYCHERKVEIRVINKITYRGLCGELTIEGHLLHVPVNDMQEQHEHTASLHCTNCGKHATMSDDEWRIPD